MSEIILALDCDSKEKAIAIAKNLKPRLKWIKIGLELFCACGPDIIHSLKELDYKVFLDLKLYDIPNTVARTVRALLRYDVNMITLHCAGGEKMCKAALEEVENFKTPLIDPQKPLLLGVTVLTSFASGEMPGIRETPFEFARHIAANAINWGIKGIVCSPHEAGAIKNKNPGITCVCPGIRPYKKLCLENDDQARFMTPAQAVITGADYLVIGRPITGAKDPELALANILEELKQS